MADVKLFHAINRSSDAMLGCRDVAWYEGQQGLHELQSGGPHGWKQLGMNIIKVFLNAKANIAPIQALAYPSHGSDSVCRKHKPGRRLPLLAAMQVRDYLPNIRSLSPFD